MVVNTPTVQRLMEVGLVAAGNGMFSDANAIFDAIEAVRPESEIPMVGRAAAKMMAGRHDEAIDLLQGALKINPRSDFALSFLGLALSLAGMSDASHKALREVVDREESKPECVDLADAILAEDGVRPTIAGGP